MATVAEAFYRDLPRDDPDYQAGLTYAVECAAEVGTHDWLECFMVGVVTERLQRERMARNTATSQNRPTEG